MFAREQACELVTGRIKVLKERIARKDELLQGYERDLAKLRSVGVLSYILRMNYCRATRETSLNSGQSEFFVIC